MPIIILQGDHGPGAYLDWDSPEDSNMDERFSILNAFHLPGVENPSFHDGQTPVNSFRIIMNEYFQADYPLLPDHSYFSKARDPLNFMEVH